MNSRERVTKIILWALIGVLAVVTTARFLLGLGRTTALTDATPWGLWIAFDVMAGVALSAGGFVIAAAVYIFKLERFRPFARPAVLTAFLGYIAVAVGLLYDLGLPWHIWHPVISPQPKSVLFEVAMCVMLYLTVLFLEFSPTILEHPAFKGNLFQSIHKILKKLTIPLVITGVVLSTLHQSSLGSLFLIAPYRLHPLWYSPNIWILFFVSAIGLGLMMVTLEAFFSGWLFGHRPDTKALAGLGRAASAVLFVYAGLRVGDMAMRGVLSHVLNGSYLSMLFVFELALGALVPATLLAIPRIRNHPSGLLTAAVMTVAGIIGYRFDVCIVAFERPEGMFYFPSWTEVAVSLGIVATALVVFIFFCERLKVFSDAHEEIPQPKPLLSPDGIPVLLPDTASRRREYSLAAVLGAAFALGMLPSSVLFGEESVRTPVEPPRTMTALVHDVAGGKGHQYQITEKSPSSMPGRRTTPVMIIDGNRNDRLVAFPHRQHEQKLGDDRSCVLCHHQNVPFDQNTSCSDCHRDMYLETDIFDHESHIEKLGHNDGCIRCHTDYAKPKTRETAEECETCHKNMVVQTSRIDPPEEGMTGIAPGYMDAMHGLCIACHEEKHKKEPARFGKWFSTCANCHRDVSEVDLKQMAPYIKTRP